MNKFKLSLFAVIAAGVVGCSGGGGGGSKADSADSLDNTTQNDVVNVVQDNTTAVAGDESSNSDNTTQNILADGLDNANQNDVANVVQDNTTAVAGDESSNSENTTQNILADGLESEVPTEEILVVDTRIAPAEVYIPNTDTVVRNGITVGKYHTLATLAIDLNKDGRNDVVKFRSAGYSNLYIEAWINNGNGTAFTNETTKYFGTIGNQYTWAHDAHVADLNDDGLLDIVAVQTGCFYQYEKDKKCLPALIQQTDGSFVVTSNPLLQSAMIDGVNIPFDIDGDGDADILHHNLVPLFNVNTGEGGGAWGGKWQQAPQFDIFENRSENGVAKYVAHMNVFDGAPEGVGDLYGAFLQGIVPVDVNGDGKLDVVTGGSRWAHTESGGGFSQEKALMSVYINNGDFTFTFSNDAWLGNTPSAISQYRLHSADFDGDGDGDIVASNTGWDSGNFDGEPNFMLWNSNGKFYTDYSTSSTHNYMGFTHQSDIGDVDGDGDMDIVYFDLGGKDVKVAGSSTWARVMKNDGTGKFASNTTSLIMREVVKNTFWLPYWTVSMRLADMNGDDRIDMIVGDQSEFGADRVVLNNGDGTFGFESEVFFEPLW